VPVLRVSALALAVLAIAVPAAQAEMPSPVLVVGDSLAVGMKPYLGELLGSSDVVWDARSGRTTPEGLVHLRARLHQVTPQTVVISLGTNDGPDPARFASRIHRVLAAIPPSACIVWTDINRPPRKGRYHGLNRVLERAAKGDPRVVLVHWDRAVLHGSVSLPDGLHPDAPGFRYRSLMVAGAIARGCTAAA
jgi:GDSL-like Lipase/Acylhydrolase family